MTWNVENFCAPQPADQAAYNAKPAELVDVIHTAKPDLLAVQEIGDEQSFEALRNELGAGWTGGFVHALREPARDPCRLALPRWSL